MRRRRASLVAAGAAVVAGLVAVAGVAPSRTATEARSTDRVSAPADAAAGTFSAFHAPPGLVRRGETVRLHLDVETSGPGRPTGGFHVRDDPDGPFTRLPLFGAGGRPVRVPPRFLDGHVLEDYVVVHDSGSARTIRVPATGSYRSWVRDSYRTIALGQHGFGHTRGPSTVVARASAGSGPGQVGFDRPTEGPWLGPSSVDVGPQGRVWASDVVNRRVHAWDPGHTDRPTRTVSMPFGPADVAVAPGGRVYVSGARPSLPMHVWAYTPRGRLLWRTRLLSDVVNAHVRVAHNGILYSTDGRYGWAPVTTARGDPLTPAQQRQRVRAYWPAGGGRALVLTERSARRYRVGLATDAGRLVRAWQITSETPLTTGFEEESTVLRGDPLLLFTAWGPGDLRERLVLRLARTDGVRARFSLACCPFGDVVTAVRVGADDRLYRLHSSPDWGVRIVRHRIG